MKKFFHSSDYPVSELKLESNEIQSFQIKENFSTTRCHYCDVITFTISSQFCYQTEHHEPVRAFFHHHQATSKPIPAPFQRTATYCGDPTSHIQHFKTSTTSATQAPEKKDTEHQVPGVKKRFSPRFKLCGKFKGTFRIERRREQKAKSTFDVACI